MTIKKINKREKFIKYSLLTCSIAFIAIGILREEHLEVLKKAINICLECIGIG